MKNKKKSKEFIVLLEPLKDSLYRYIKNLLWNNNDVDDIFQTAILNAYNSFDKFAEGTNFKAWIFTFLTNTIFNANRKHEKISRCEIKLEKNELESIVEVYEQEVVYLSILEKPDEILEMVESNIKNSLNTLNSVERSAFLLKTVDEFSYKEISDILKIPTGTVMSHISRARIKLRMLLCKYAKETGFLKKII